MSGGRSEVGTRRSSSRISSSVAALAKRRSPLSATQRPRYLGASALSHLYSRERQASFLRDGVAEGGDNSDRRLAMRGSLKTREGAAPSRCLAAGTCSA